MGRSRGGLTTKIHAVVDANGNAVSLKLTEGQAHDGRSAADMLDTVGEGQILLDLRTKEGTKAALGGLYRIGGAIDVDGNHDRIVAVLRKPASQLAGAGGFA